MVSGHGTLPPDLYSKVCELSGLAASGQLNTAPTNQLTDEALLVRPNTNSTTVAESAIAAGFVYTVPKTILKQLGLVNYAEKNLWQRIIADVNARYDDYDPANHYYTRSFGYHFHGYGGGYGSYDAPLPIDAMNEVAAKMAAKRAREAEAAAKLAPCVLLDTATRRVVAIATRSELETNAIPQLTAIIKARAGNLDARVVLSGLTPKQLKQRRKSDEAAMKLYFDTLAQSPTLPELQAVFSALQPPFLSSCLATWSRVASSESVWRSRAGAR